jgi:hypothetical protein
VGLEQNALGKIHPLVQLGHFLPESIYLGQELRVLHGLHMATQAVR